MTTHQLTDWEDVLEISVFAISSHLEDYQLAFSFNKSLGSQLSCIPPLKFKLKEGEHLFNAYYSNHQPQLPSFYMVDNTSVKSTSTLNYAGLFNDDDHLQSVLLKSLKKWPFFIISNEYLPKNLLKQLLNIEHITYVQNIDYQTFNKSEQNILSSILYDQ